MTRAKSVVTLLALACSLLLFGCAGQSGGDATEGSSETRSVAHDAGTTEITGTPQRVVALEFSFVDALDMLGTEPVGIADDEKSERVSQLLGEEIDYTSVGTRSEPNQEVIASLQPDLIIADTQRHSDVYDALSEIAPTIVLDSREGSYQDMKDNTVTIAEALGDRSAGEDAVAAHEQRMAEIAAQVPEGEDRTVQLVTARDELLRIHTSSSFVGSVMEAAGLRVAAQDDQEPYEDASLERIAQVDPDVLFVSSDVDTPITDSWAGNPVWENMTAVSGGQVHDADRNLYTRFRGLSVAETVAQQVVDTMNGK